MGFPALHRIPAAAFLVAAAVGATGCVEIMAGPLGAIDREEKRFTIDGRPAVDLSTFDGSIEVRPWDRSEVLVVVEKFALTTEAAAGMEIVTEQKGNQIRLEVRVKDRHSWHVNRHARLIVSLPEASDLTVTSGDGSIDVERVSGRLELRTGDGSIRGRDLAGDVRAQTGDGSISLDGIDGGLDIGTGDGSVVANGKFSGLRARSGDGSMRIHAASGSVATDDWNITTGDGSITIELPDAFDAELDAHTGDGRISLGGSLSETTEKTRRTVRGRIGAGGRSLRVRSGDGSITLRRS